MDAVTDLSARTITFLVLLDDILLQHELNHGRNKQHENAIIEFINGTTSEELQQFFKERIKKAEANEEQYLNLLSRCQEIAWIDQMPPVEKAVQYTVSVIIALVNWLKTNQDAFINKEELHNFSTPYFWRESISNFLYNNPEKRITLATAIRYVPIQVILALGGGGNSAERQRLFQFWHPDLKDDELLLTADEKENIAEFEIESLNKVLKYLKQNIADEKALQKDLGKSKAELARPRMLYVIIKNYFTSFFSNLIELPEVKELIEKNNIKISMDVENKDLLGEIQKLEKIYQNLTPWYKTKTSEPQNKLAIAFFKLATKELISSDAMLKAWLLNADVSLPFEFVFNEELSEIVKAREMRKVDNGNNEKEREKKEEVNFFKGIYSYFTNEKTAPLDVPAVSEETINKNIYSKAEERNLFALAFSGGGIRSATFGLGILQGLAKRNVLHRFDYVSTSSGGGYISSWFVTWMKRLGSVKKVADRLNTEKCADPMAEEVRPIRWLRMFSNYFNPNSSFSSTDSWTVGITLIRNMLLNLSVIILMLFTALMIGYLFYRSWILAGYIPFYWFLGICAFFLVSSAVFAGIGMSTYSQKPITLPNLQKISRNKGIKHTWFGTFINYLSKKIVWNISVWILVSGCIGAFLISAYFYSHPTTCLDIINGLNDVVYYMLSLRINDMNFRPLTNFLGTCLITMLCLFLVSWLGHYYDYLKIQMRPTFWRRIKIYLRIFFSTLVSVIIAAVSILAVWTFFNTIVNKVYEFEFPQIVRQKMVFVIGLPLLFEVFSLTVVTRMALLGKFFPDERREWWGRLGALIHRISVAWLLIAACIMLGGFVHEFLEINYKVTIAAFGGWVGIIAGAVKAAGSSKTDGQSKSATKKINFLNILSLLGPYIFIIGIMVYLPVLLKPFILNIIKLSKVILIKSNLFEEQFPYYWMDTSVPFLIILTIIVALLAFLTYWLSSTIGVNEFTMHHFYKNRLIRAYLGATRRRTEREKTANSFTNFDRKDDEKLSNFTTAKGYYGPYPILNAALNASEVTELDRQDRKAESFTFSPLYSGFDFSRTRSSIASKTKSYDYGYRRTAQYAYKSGPTIGTAMAISGAAASSNMGYHTNAATAFLLTVFNVQMGWWIGNPRQGNWKSSSPTFGLGYMIKNLTGNTNTHNDYVYLSDAGHFDNMGLYELVRRRNAFIVLCDAEQDENFASEGLANAIRRCRIDFGTEIEIDIIPITKRTERISSQSHAFGTIRYPSGRIGILLYIKSSLSAKDCLPVDVVEYAERNPTFPHQSTSDQFFDEQQFESYRKLSMHILDTFFEQMGDELKEFITTNKLPVSKKLEEKLKDFFGK